ncbi:MAG: hypothetical protein ISR58_15915 [Anaerolineales bacterium]|nr:hypothetical protein [Chloroflexota bacterium]MBL6982660.1 hypothetical protein [Anaerolineales bacterium]
MRGFNKFLDRVSDYLSKRKGLVPLVGIILVALNFILRQIPGLGWFSESDLFLHLGVILGILGFMIAWAL